MSFKRTPCSKRTLADREPDEFNWILLKDDLANFDYWKSNSPSLWSITDYDSSLLKIRSLDKRQCHNSLGNDLVILKSACNHQPQLSKIVAQLQKRLASVSTDKVNRQLWETVAPDLTKVMLQGIPITSDLKNKSVALANSTIATMVSSSTSSTSSTSSSSSPLRSSGSGSGSMFSSSTTCADGVMEFDSLYMESGLSIGTIIKRKARLLLDQQIDGKALYPRERKIMSNGLSSILDIADCSYESQRSLFTSDEWRKITSIMKSRHPLTKSEKNLELTNVCNIVCASVESSRNLNSGLLYVYKMYHRYQGTNLMPGLKVMEHVLDIIGHYPHLLERDPQVNVSEYDYLTFLWIPLFSRLFPHETKIRIKTGETCYDYSAVKKRQQYPDGAHVIGFKIDLRCLVDMNQTEYDICSMEVSCNAGNGDKLVTDEGKLNREMKDDLDAMIDLGQNATKCCSWGVQICGAACLILSTHLTDNGLYVVLPRFEFALPSCIADLTDFLGTLESLLSFRHCILQAADLTIRHIEHKNTFTTLTGCSQRSINSKQRSTWYTPPENKQPRQPLHFHGHPPQSLTTRLLEEEMKTSATKPTVSDDDDDELLADQFGWCKKDGLWYNVLTHEKTTDDPYEPLKQQKQ